MQFIFHLPNAGRVPKTLALFQTFLSDIFHNNNEVKQKGNFVWLSGLLLHFSTMGTNPDNQWCALSTRWQQALECYSIYFSLNRCWTHYSRTQGLHNTSAVWRSGGCESTLRHNCRHISDVFITLGVLLLVLAAKLSQEITHKALAQQSTGGTFYCTVILPRLWKTTVL